ncbi:PLP-dependent aminotransferase family protein [Gracilinema caldarium]|uniref:Transcriptional regulator, GntR family with aminotransferase domain n=1 Tax=Gracilinema caldarium (strain ATCC 51460 / DSM 7334 / H1) TaxID=744872 RepID=F8F2G5_GRAC1|nr:PLP-dependent aminotransferase family protein [Gracilinema caldarium]AEJ19080.1 transcriptional regulator, GntR family with aminotransferase domain [Gracilinema caldarium DSM 7334]
MKYENLMLNTDSENPLYLQLADSLRHAISRGEVMDGERLPSIRRLSHTIQVNPATVVAAYRILEQEGWVRSRPGSGVYVRHKKNLADLDITETDLRSSLAFQHTNDGTFLDLAAGTPSPDLFPVDQFKTILHEVLDRDAGWAFEYQHSAGWAPFRQTLSRYAEEILQISAPPSTIWVVSGAQQGIDLTSKALLHPGDRVILEAPTYRGALGAFWSRGADTIALPLYPTGWDMDLLEKRLAETRPRLLYIQSRFQTPTTYSWGTEELYRLLELAAKYDAYILEDDLLSDLYFDQPPEPLNLKSIDQHSRVIYVRGFSKVLLPGLRLGLLIVPPALQNLYEQAKQSSDIATDSFMQRAVDLYLSGDHHKRRMDELRERYGRLYKHSISTVSQHLLPLGCSQHSCTGGLHLWIGLPEGIKSADLYTHALKTGVRIMPGEAFQDPTHIRLSFACIEADQIDEGISRLAQSLKELMHTPLY